MNHHDLIKGIGIGLVAGGALSIAVTSGGQKRRRKKGNTMRAVGEVVENVTDMFGF